MKSKKVMFYKFDNTELVFKKVRLQKAYFILGALYVVSMAATYSVGRITKIARLTEYEKEVLLINMEYPPFSEADLIAELKRLNIKFPYIVLAQAKLESSTFSSNIFRHNHNLFGMKEAKQRITTAVGTSRNHAYYRDWIESVYDYGFYQASYLGKIKTEEDYYRYLGHRYAEDPGYIAKLKNLINKENLKSKF